MTVQTIGYFWTLTLCSNLRSRYGCWGGCCVTHQWCARACRTSNPARKYPMRSWRRRQHERNACSYASTSQARLDHLCNCRCAISSKMNAEDEMEGKVRRIVYVVLLCRFVRIRPAFLDFSVQVLMQARSCLRIRIKCSVPGTGTHLSKRHDIMC